MREAIGGAWLYYIFIVVIIFIVSFLAVFLNYMAAYRANNQVISILEQSEGIVPSNINQMIDANFTLGKDGDFKSCTISYGDKGFIIRVAAFMKLEIPLVNVKLKVPVKNETRTIRCDGQACPPSEQSSVVQSLKSYLNYTGDCTNSTGW